LWTSHSSGWRGPTGRNLVCANECLRDRFTADWLAIGYVQGGLLAVAVHGADAGSVWFYDNDDHRDLDRYTAEDICGRLLLRCGDDFGSFWHALRPVPEWLRALASATATSGDAEQVFPDRLGTHLPMTKRTQGSGGGEMSAPWQPANDTEQAMVEALSRGDRREYFRLLATANLYLPLFVQSESEGADPDLVTADLAGQTILLVFTSV
jgi:hypothetical protein